MRARAATRVPGAPVKVAVTNTVALNGGDAAILLAELELLRRSFGEETEFVVFDDQAAIAQRQYPELDFRESLYHRAVRRWRAPLVGPLRRLSLARFYAGAWCWTRSWKGAARLLLTPDELRDLAEYASADLIVSTGGTYLVENYALAPRLLGYRLARWLGKPVVLFTQSMGPFTRRRTRRAMRGVLERAALVLLRDEASLRHVRELGVAGDHVRVSADAAFALGRDAGPAAGRDEAGPGGAPRVVVSVRHWKYFEGATAEEGMRRYREAVAAVTAHLVERHGARVTFLSTCQGIPEYWTDDSRVAERIAASLPPEVAERVRVDRDFHAPEALIEVLRGQDLVIATRMHMAILSLVAGVPVVPISYEFKTRELFEQLGLPWLVHDIETVAAAGLARTCDEVLARQGELRRAVREAAAGERERAVGVVEKLGELRKGRVPVAGGLLTAGRQSRTGWDDAS